MNLLDLANLAILKGWPGGPHLLVPFVGELWWTICFAVSSVTGVWSLKLYRNDRSRLIKARLNGGALITATNAVRDATVRCLISPPALLVGVWALSIPDVPIATGRGILIEFLFIALGSGYALVGYWRLHDRDRLLDLIRKERNRRDLVRREGSE